MQENNFFYKKMIANCLLIVRLLSAFRSAQWWSLCTVGRIGSKPGGLRRIRVPAGRRCPALNQPYQGCSPGGPCRGGSTANSSGQKNSGNPSVSALLVGKFAPMNVRVHVFLTQIINTPSKSVTIDAVNL